MRIASSVSLLSLLLVLPACGSTSREDAQNDAADAACDYYEECEQIGDDADAQFEDRDECEVKVRDFFQAAWTEGNCASIDEDGLDTCLSRIRSTSCSSGADFLNTAFVVCAADAVCQDDAD